ncbi:YwqG family protein [Cytobacillus firmus]|uniref:YwqG family protein n=1 Tax=Cytobacillus firmus TaxID=1399 RepID=UPI002228245A|nr:YwqG family protein [Cytobacillus firmus]
MNNFVSFFKINCYTKLDELQKKNEQSTKIKPFPLTPLFIDNDTPSWEDSNNISLEIENEILRLELEEGIEYFEDIVEKIYSTHKVGGYPSFTQGGVSFGEDYPFVFQISSDEKAHFNIVDSGSFYFFYNLEKQDWIVYCDFY